MYEWPMNGYGGSSNGQDTLAITLATPRLAVYSISSTNLRKYQQ